MPTPSQTTQLYAGVREAILSLTLSPGERLTERGIETAFGASRTPARAALNRLESEGLVMRDGRGWRVSPIDLGEIQSLSELRVAVESAAVRFTVERADDARIRELMTGLDAARPAASEEQVRAGGDFHSELAALSGNRFMTETVRGAMTRLARTRFLEVRTEEARRTAWQEHRDVVAAVLARDADRATELVAAHVTGTNERLLVALKADHVRLRGHGVAVIDSHS